MVPETVAQEDELRKTIATCLDLEEPKSFFLYAGAGTGKTRAVVEALHIFRDRYGPQFRQSGQQVAVITYTNAACDEIRRRIDFDPIFSVSTIHSFAWEQIRAHHKDISTSGSAYSCLQMSPNFTRNKRQGGQEQKPLLSGRFRLGRSRIDFRISLSSSGSPTTQIAKTSWQKLTSTR